MRLVCPSCDAEYEIARSAIPRSGREVECSNCGHSWFQAFADLRIDEAVLNAPDETPDTDYTIGCPALDSNRSKGRQIRMGRSPTSSYQALVVR